MLVFRKLRRVNEELKQCEWQGVFDVILAAVTHHVFERNINSTLPDNEVSKMATLAFLNKSTVTHPQITYVLM